MFRPVSLLIAYYRSPKFTVEHAYLARYDPLAAEQQRYAIIGNVDENLATAGITATRTEVIAHQRFIAGQMSLAQIMCQVERCVASYERRCAYKPL